MVRSAMTLVRSAIFQVVFYATFIVMMVFGSPCLVLPRPALLWWVRAWARVSVWLLAVICGTKVEFRNLERVPRGGSMGATILAAKHQSFFETFALVTVVDDFAFVLKKELTTMPLFGWWATRTEQIGIDRSKRGGTLSGLQRAVRARLAVGRQVIIFPEGTRRPIGAPPAYKPGVAVLVADTGVSCTPVALNSGLFWPRRSFLRRPGTIVFEFLPPIPSGLSKRAFMAALEGAIEPATDALVAEALATDPSLAGAMAQAGAPRRADKTGEKTGKSPATA